jgi:hypothetical protein
LFLILNKKFYSYFARRILKSLPWQGNFPPRLMFSHVQVNRVIRQMHPLRFVLGENTKHKTGKIRIMTLENLDNPTERDFRENVLPYLIPGASKNILLGHSSGESKFEIDLGNDFASGTPYDTKNTRFVHFTSLRNLQSIINENAIRLYSMVNVNDPWEYHYFTGDEPENDKPSMVKSNTYILSLCDVSVLDGENILNLWRLYGNEGWGVAIEFDIKFHGASTVQSDYFLGKVIYQKPTLEEFKVKLAEFEQRNNVKTDPTKLMRIPACFHKNPHYRIEEEVRLMTFDTTSTRIATFSPEQSRFKWDFNAHNKLVVYNKLKLSRGNENPWITIKRIQLGFQHSKESFRQIEKHFKDLFLALKIKDTTELNAELPKVELSPLGNIFR